MGKNYEPVIVEDICLIKTDFHKIERQYQYEIVINPRMSFGTGHHSTTYLMIKAQLDIDFKDMDVLDIGCGTGVLAIMASKLGANSIIATDINDWAIENAGQNFELNGVKDFKILQDVISNLDLPEFDIILANINKNVLLDEMPEYYKNMRERAVLILSGFLRGDVEEIRKSAENQGLSYVETNFREEWACAIFKK